MNTLFRYLLRWVFWHRPREPQSEAVESLNYQLEQLQGPKRRLSAKLEATGFPLGDAALGRIPRHEGR